MGISKKTIRLYASAKAVITQYLYLPGSHRLNNVIKRIDKLVNSEVESGIEKVMRAFAGRHRNIEQTFLNHFSRIADQNKSSLEYFSLQKKILLGAFFTKEYSIEAAALFNPSIVPHPDQQGLKADEQRFIMSLRATGEGHISSIVFQTGIIDNMANITLDNSTGYFTPLKKRLDTSYNKLFISKRAATIPEFNRSILDNLPESFSAAEASHILNSIKPTEPSIIDSVMVFEKIMDNNYELESSSHVPLNEKVIFPISNAESMGMEDARFVKFHDGEQYCYYGTYTAYNGKHIQTHLIETTNFDVFKIRALYGAAVADKGMALFPEKVNGKYAMISRQGGEKINIMFSENLYFWKDFQILMEPRYPWEFLQVGNCGSPIKTTKGWLLLTHGVGAMRTYVISAILLDLHDPTRIVGRLDKPLIEADENEREGYVPNVVYTCGFMLHGNHLIIPYAVSDSATAFATIGLDEILRDMKL